MEISRRHAEWQKILALTEHSQAHPRKAMVRRRLGDAGPGGRGAGRCGGGYEEVQPGGPTVPRGERKPANPLTAGQAHVAFKCHNGKHIKAESNEELRASSSVIKEPEKFEVERSDNESIYLKSHTGKYLAVDKNGDVHASGASASGWICLPSLAPGEWAPNGRIRANRSLIGSWELFQVKDRSRRSRSERYPGDGLPEPDEQDDAPAFFDAFCQVEGILTAEERYAKTHHDRTAVLFDKRARSRRRDRVEWSFKHFYVEKEYPPCFRGCLSAWDITRVEIDPDGETDTPKAEDTEDAVRPRTCSGSDGSEVANFDGLEAGKCHWKKILHEDLTDAVRIIPAFGVPAASAADADEAAWQRLLATCSSGLCKAVGPIGVDCSSLPPALDAVFAERFAGLSAGSIRQKFGTLPGEAYDVDKDPVFLAWKRAAGPTARGEEWVLEHADRRLAEFEAARSDYERRRLSEQVSTAKPLGPDTLLGAACRLALRLAVSCRLLIDRLQLAASSRPPCQNLRKPRTFLLPAQQLAAPAVVFDPYADEAILNTLRLTGGADQLALNNLRNIYYLVAIRAGTPERFRAYRDLDRRIDAEESSFWKGFSDADICGLAASAGLSESMVGIWREWVSVAYLRAGRMPPPR
eukprot:s519_g38.t1